jgi:long-subunit acyl-CoA synthetase (AMP-forming)
MHLTKDDIEQVAFSRFNKKNARYLYLSALGAVAALVAFTLGLSRLFPDNIWLWFSADIAILALLCVAAVRYSKAQQRAARELVKQCEADPHLIYVPDQKAATAKGEVTDPIK